MAGKTKNEGGRNASKKKQQIDEYQLRKEIREVMKMGDDTNREQNAVRLNEDNKEISKYTEDYRIGGVEGGGTHSMLIIIDGRGRKLTEVQGSHTNHWALGMEETAARINAMIDKGKEELGIKRPLDCVGLSLSGCEEESTNVLLKQKLLENHPEASKDYVISSDTLGSLRTAVERGGIVLIAGTGSNALLITPDGETHGCGGWGYMMGDEGSAYWIAARLCKYVFDDMDGFSKAPYSIDWVWSAIKDHFGIKTRQEMLPHLYTNFDKSNIAQFAKQVVVGCEKGDELCKFVFEEAGRALAKHVEALSTKTGNDMKLASGGLKVICVGSVWKSWRFLKNGFVNQIHEGGLIDELSLLRLTTSSAIGACYLAAEKLNCSLIKTYETNAETFFHYNRQNYPKANANDSGDCSSEK